MKRNVGIVLDSVLVFAYLNPNSPHGGGTSHGVRIANDLGITVIRLNSESERETALETIKNLKNQ